MTPVRRPRITAFGLSIAIHAALAVVLLVIAGLGPEPVSTKAVPIRTDLVFLQHTGAGGGGGGNPRPAPPRPMQIPVHKQPTLAIEAVAVPKDPPPTLDVRVQANSTFLQATGTDLFAKPGPGGGGKPGSTGLGPGDGSGGPGPGKGGIGDTPGSGGAATPPVPIRQVKPVYTGGALASKIQGSATLEVEVLANGTVGNVKVIKSLDRIHGLDLEAIRAARQWLFIPARNAAGRPVDVIVQLILDFNLR
jgi:TonB family protein